MVRVILIYRGVMAFPERRFSVIFSTNKIMA